MSLLLLAAAVLAASQDSADAYYKFKVGTTWTLQAPASEKSPRITKLELKVVKEEAGRIELESRRYIGGDEPNLQIMCWSVADGMMSWSELREGAERDKAGLLKVGSKKGDSWEWIMNDKKGKVTNLGTEEVKVPAGTYKDTVHVQCALKDGPADFSLDLYFAPGAGPVKLVTRLGDQPGQSLELKEFKPAK